MKTAESKPTVAKGAVLGSKEPKQSALTQIKEALSNIKLGIYLF